MTTVSVNFIQKKQCILDHEEIIASQLARKVVDKPHISLWMILIPIIFIFHFQFYRRWKAGVKLFVEAYMKDLRTLFKSVEEDQISGGDTYPSFSSSISGALEKPVRAYQKFMKEHFKKLLDANGTSYAEMVRAAYPSAADYRAYIAQRTTLTKNIEDTLGLKELAQVAVQEKIHSVLPTIQDRFVQHIYGSSPAS